MFKIRDARSTGILMSAWFSVTAKPGLMGVGSSVWCAPIASCVVNPSGPVPRFALYIRRLLGLVFHGGQGGR
eukprot:6473726-Amphidinium_carterae.2